jgi:hypothetical protein
MRQKPIPGVGFLERQPKTDPRDPFLPLYGVTRCQVAPPSRRLVSGPQVPGL